MRPPRTLALVPLLALPLLTVAACAPPVPSSPQADPAAPSAQTAIAAVVTAESLGGGRAFSLEHDDGGEWEVLVAAGDVQNEVRVSTDGAGVVASSAQDALDTDDRADLAAATTTLADAIRIATAHGAGSAGIDEVSVEGSKGSRSWRVEFGDGTTLDVALTDGAVTRATS